MVAEGLAGRRRLRGRRRDLDGGGSRRGGGAAPATGGAGGGAATGGGGGGAAAGPTTPGTRAKITANKITPVRAPPPPVHTPGADQAPTPTVL